MLADLETLDRIHVALGQTAVDAQIQASLIHIMA